MQIHKSILEKKEALEISWYRMAKDLDIPQDSMYRIKRTGRINPHYNRMLENYLDDKIDELIQP